MNSQVKDLVDRGISAVALNSEGGNIEDLFEKANSLHVRLKYRVIFVSPEMALTRRFHQQVLQHKASQNNCIEMVIDKVHCITEWGDNFCEEYAKLSQLLARLPSALPVLLASATMPPDPEAFVFYHRHIDSKEKLLIQEGLRSGSHCCVVATDALGMGMDFQNIKRVILWREPPSFLSLVQKIGRCVRRLSQCGEAIVLVTKSTYTQHLLNLETDGKEVNIEDDLDDDIIQEPIQAQIDQIKVIDWEDPEVNGDDDEPMGAVTG
ncbi:P-loop containing nucleoside triphosphate hydrolase protein [Dendrothele bispora CBS 962.96]|uniref:DNA 3'-5' helicase n=1 Tax=Dendrothele bispora (strain CBS 962.96) TaxID=1314807 RepID=A0A4S8M239_DENBC|nr:P-loop containing nucleoside triphosphate hydrolase protein [Dendrothele bispora CBS 962.96]